MNNKFRNRLAAFIVVSIMGIIATIILLPYAKGLGGHTGWQEEMMSTLGVTLDVFVGILGLVIGYYFGAKQSD